MGTARLPFSVFPAAVFLLSRCRITRKKRGKMKLNIYEKKKVVKTYETDTYDLMFGTVEDIADAIKLDELQTGADVEIIVMAGNLIKTSKETVKELLKDIFDGLTDDEIKKTKINEIVTCLVDVVKFTVSQLNIGKSKN